MIIQWAEDYIADPDKDSQDKNSQTVRYDQSC